MDKGYEHRIHRKDKGYKQKIHKKAVKFIGDGQRIGTQNSQES